MDHNNTTVQAIETALAEIDAGMPRINFSSEKGLTPEQMAALIASEVDRPARLPRPQAEEISLAAKALAQAEGIDPALFNPDYQGDQKGLLDDGLVQEKKYWTRMTDSTWMRKMMRALFTDTDFRRISKKQMTREVAEVCRLVARWGLDMDSQRRSYRELAQELQPWLLAHVEELKPYLRQLASPEHYGTCPEADICNLYAFSALIWAQMHPEDLIDAQAVKKAAIQLLGLGLKDMEACAYVGSTIRRQNRELLEKALAGFAEKESFDSLHFPEGQNEEMRKEIQKEVTEWNERLQEKYPGFVEFYLPIHTASLAYRKENNLSYANLAAGTKRSLTMKTKKFYTADTTAGSYLQGLFPYAVEAVLKNEQKAQKEVFSFLPHRLDWMSKQVLTVLYPGLQPGDSSLPEQASFLGFSWICAMLAAALENASDNTVQMEEAIMQASRKAKFQTPVETVLLSEISMPEDRKKAALAIETILRADGGQTVMLNTLLEARGLDKKTFPAWSQTFFEEIIQDGTGEDIHRKLQDMAYQFLVLYLMKEDVLAMLSPFLCEGAITFAQLYKNSKK